MRTLAREKVIQMFNEQRPVQILELFGGIGSPRCALRNLGIPTKAIDYVEIDEKAVRSYNSMFAEELPYKTQSVVGWNLKPDILIHGSPCQDFSIAGQQKGADEGSETRSSLMWETIHIIEQMGKWKPKYVIWENVRNVTSRHMIANFVRYQKEMERMGYTNSYEVLDAREFGLPQARERVFTISTLGGEKFCFDELIRTPMRSIDKFLEKNEEVPEVYDVTQPSVRDVIGVTGSVKRATVIKDYAFTITTRQDRTPAQVIDCGEGRYRYLTELECWRLQGYSDEDFEKAKKVQKKKGRYYTALYKQAGNSIAVPIFESIFRKIILNEVRKTTNGDVV
jgi:DNA (cytosine-5)-methyltransferase 1